MPPPFLPKGDSWYRRRHVVWRPKKSSRPNSDLEDCTQFLHPHTFSSPREKVVRARAGLLALGSSYSSGLPRNLQVSSGMSWVSSPITAAGPHGYRTHFPFRPCHTDM